MIRAALALVSASILAYEVLLIRLFSIVQWHHFTYMVISIALLGFGASGTFLALTRDWLLPRFATAFAVSAALFSLTAFLGYVAGQSLPFNAPALIWEPRQLLFLLGLYVIFLVPFFFGARANPIGVRTTPTELASAFFCKSSNALSPSASMLSSIA